MYIVIGILIFLGVAIYDACQPETPAEYHRNWKLENEDAMKVQLGQMTRGQFNRNIKNGKYR